MRRPCFFLLRVFCWGPRQRFTETDGMRKRETDGSGALVKRRGGNSGGMTAETPEVRVFCAFCVFGISGLFEN